ncbi:exodeoxyribonuclease VII large subunit [Reichenbachiella versicolor]|uniref:exodeoxyribonuclease VII large subunit n=1 Tax=Reichenbachiella versicolor TaxID=1821036 RepID=UPI000D6DDC3D|nr:exodeoxyribonuclease VII large subunit [Reichenbachiella versicolor]
MEHYSLSQFNVEVKQTLKNALEPSYWIVCEIGELNLHRNGHCYLELVEKKDSRILAKIRATIWSYTYANIHRLFHRITGSDLSVGMQILINATLEFHEVYGLSLNVKDIDPNYTLGERERKRQATIQQLVEDGILDLNKSLILPLVPQRIAVISAEGAAGYGDFMNQLNNNSYGYVIHTKLFNATMQGEGAPISILDQLHRIYELEEEYDAVVVIRGGGSKMDLDCFDDYELNAHLAQFPLPIITGIGHDRDETIADLVANISLKTPTAVAEFLLSGFMDFESKITEVFDRIKNLIELQLSNETFIIQQLKHDLAQKAGIKILSEENKLDKISSSIESNSQTLLKSELSRLQLTSKILEARDPKSILKKGFTITKVNGKSINGQNIKEGDIIETQTATNKIISKVEKS